MASCINRLLVVGGSVAAMETALVASSSSSSSSSASSRAEPKGSENVGYLELIFGPMYSGKTSKLLELYKQFCFCEIPTAVINYKEDTRYSATMLSTHDKTMIPCVHAHLLQEVDVSDVKVILINEGQFFEDIVPWVKEAIEVQKKHVYICGLDGDFQRQAFSSHWLDLVPFCDNIVKLRSFCSHCKAQYALFSHRLTAEAEQIVIGAANYVPLCRACYVTATSD